MSIAERIVMGARELIADAFAALGWLVETDTTARVTVTIVASLCVYVVLAKFAAPALERRLLMVGFALSMGHRSRAVGIVSALIAHTALFVVAAVIGNWGVGYRFAWSATGASVADVMNLIAIIFAVV